MTLPVVYQPNQAPMYYRGANAALLLYDITNAATFEDIRGWLAGAYHYISFWGFLSDTIGTHLRVEEKLSARAHHLYCRLQSRPPST
jgi:hypothetical protein